jgi:hypothetical protein
VWGRCTKAYIGVWEESGRIRIQTRDKIRVWLKMKSRKIQRLELVSDKIDAKDSKRKVVHIRFGCPMKKNGLGWSSP